MSLLLSVQCGEEVTPAQLLGREDEEKQTRIADAEEHLEKLLPSVRRNLPAEGVHYEVVEEL